MPGELRVDTTPLATEGQGLLSAAGDIPQPPVPFTATGADALSTILNARTQAMEAPLIAGLPVTKAEALRTAQNIIQAAAKYEGVDQQLADQVLKALAELEGAEGMGAGGAGGVWRWRSGCGGHGWHTGDRGDVRRDSGGGRRAAGGSDGPVDGHADAAGTAGCPDTNAIGGNGGIHSAGDHAGRAERDAAGRPNDRRRRGRDRSGDGSAGRRVTGRGEACRIGRGEARAPGGDSLRGRCRTEQCGTGAGDWAAAHAVAGSSAAAAQAGAHTTGDVRTGKRSVT